MGLIIALFYIAGCDISLPSPEGLIRYSLQTSRLQTSHLQTALPKTWKPYTITDSTTRITATAGRFPIQASPKPTKKRAEFHGVGFSTDGMETIEHMEFTHALDSLQIGDILRAAEFDGRTKQISDLSVTQTADGLVTRAVFTPHPSSGMTTASRVLVRVFDQATDIEHPIYARLFDRQALAFGIKDLPTSPQGACIGTEEEIRICHEHTVIDTFLRRSNLGDAKSVALAKKAWKLCLPSSLGKCGIDYSCWSASQNKPINIEATLGKTETKESNSEHLRFDFHLIPDGIDPLRYIIRDPQITISAYTLSGFSALPLAGYLKKMSPIKLAVWVDYFKEVTELKMDELTLSNN